MKLSEKSDIDDFARELVDFLNERNYRIVLYDNDIFHIQNLKTDEYLDYPTDLFDCLRLKK